MSAKTSAEAKEPKPFHKRAGRKVWLFFNSLKLTLAVMLTLAFAAGVGTIIEQGLRPSEYVRAFGPKWTGVIFYAQVNDLYHAWWFTALLGLLCLNIFVCTLERFPPKWKSLLNQKPQGKFNPRIITNCSHNSTIAMASDHEKARDKVLSVFKKKKYKTQVTTEADGHYIYAWRGTIGRFGSDIVHISLFLILFGSMIGGYYGYKDNKIVYEGDTMIVPEAPFEVRLDKFWMDFYDTGQIKQYNSLLTVIEQGKEVLQKQIWVNEPLYYKGIRFYQSNYGSAWDRIKRADIGLLRKDGKRIEQTMSVDWGERVDVEGTPYSIRLMGYAADFAYDNNSKTVFSQSAEANNPAVHIEIYKGDELISNPWLFLNYPGIFPAIPDSEDDLVFAGFSGIMYSGISLNKDPGVNIVWAGALVMGLGFFLAFFITHKRLWIYIKSTGNSSEVKIGGFINKNQFALEKELKEIVRRIESD
ncbi:MAG: cytochrome c biogenesis protein ResB [Thermodesulfobacteriota bacterium]